MSEIEQGNCDMCSQKDIHVNRKYYYYDLECECCGSRHDGKKVHFEIVYHCNDCEPKPPRSVKAMIKPI